MIDVAIKAAKEAAKIHLKYYRKDNFLKTKSASYDILTKADLESEKIIVKTIKKFFPGHNFLCEENKYEKTPSPYVWIIDPLDGTNNYSHHVPIFCVSIALAKNDNIILGVVYDPTRNELFHAEKGKGAFLNKKKIRVTDAADFSRAIMATGFYYDRGKPMEETLDNIGKFLKKGIIGIRRLGSAAIDLCYVACGRFDGFWEFTLNPWDFAAGKLIVEEAGGKLTDKAGNDPGINKEYIVASNGKLHKKILDVLRNPSQG